MQKFKSLVCTLIVSALLIPYTAFAAENTRYGYGEGVIKDPFDSRTGDTFSLAATSEPLSATETTLLRYLASKIPELNPSIKIPQEYRISEERFKEIYTNYMGSLLQFEHPEIFYLADKFGYDYIMDEQHTITSLNIFFKPEYSNVSSANTSAIKEAQAVINEEISNITNACEGMSDLEKALYVHDYITVNYDYDTRVYSDEEGVDGNRTLDKMVEEKTGVCQGYTYLYMTAMKQLGIECIAVPTDELHHVWNKVKLDGQWYNVDVTYDDPIASNIVTASHKYFLVNDDEIKDLDPSVTTLKAYRLENNTAYEIESPDITYVSNDTVTITNGDGTVSITGYVYSYPYEFADEAGWNIIYSGNNPVALYKSTERSCHIRWNETTWDGKNSEVSTSTQYSYSPLHSISGPTVYTDGKFFCFDAYNNLCEIVFENTQQILRERYVLSRDYKWYGHGQHNGYYRQQDDESLPYYSSVLALYDGRIFFNSPNTIYEFNPSDYSVKEIYKYSGDPDASETYFYGLRVNSDGLSVEYAEAPLDEVTLISIAVPEAPKPTEEPSSTPEAFPEFDVPLPVEKPTVEAEVKEVLTDEDTGEEITNYEVTMSVYIPEEVKEAAIDKDKPVTVSIAKYNEFGGFIGFEIVEVDENNQAKFEADSTCDLIKTFIWAGFIMPLSESTEYQFNQTTE